MAVDKKSDHYTSAQNYTDLDGMSKSFTFIDHDKKTSISTVDTSNAKAELREAMDRKIEEILAMPAVSALKNKDGLYEEFVLRDPEKGITWSENAVKEVCHINPTMAYNLWNQVWRGTVKFEYWWGPYLSHEEILEGKWKELM